MLFRSIPASLGPGADAEPAAGAKIAAKGEARVDLQLLRRQVETATDPQQRAALLAKLLEAARAAGDQPLVQWAEAERARPQAAPQPLKKN